MSLRYLTNPKIDPSEVTELLQRCGVEHSEEEVHRLARIQPRLNLVLAAYDDDKLVGLARGLKEMSGCCYLSDLIVDREYQPEGLGEHLIRQVRRAVGEHALILLVPAPDALVGLA